MQNISIFSGNNKVYAALEQGCRLLGLETHHFELECLSAGPKSTISHLSNTSLAVVLTNQPRYNSALASAHAVRLRCGPHRFQGPIAIVETSLDRHKIPTELIETLGIHVVQVPHALLRLAALAHVQRRWETYPNIECRPTWALKVEAGFLAHRTRNVFGWIDEHLQTSPHMYVKSWIQDVKKILLPED